YLAKMEDMDKEIQSLIKDLPQSYSTEISCIDIQIAKLAKDACKTTSYIKMQEYKNKIDELSNKKVIVLGSCSPAGSKIRELIDKRLKIESESKTSADNIRSNTAGIVTYKTDGLEQSININDITKYDISKFDSIIESYSQNKLNNYGIKIVDNYLAYILLKEPRGQNDKYINLGQKYTIKLTDKNSIILSATLVTKLQNEISNYVVFKLTNGVENIIDAREIPIEIIWTKKTGMAIPTSSIKKAQNSEYEYVTSVNGSQYLDIPIETILSSDSISIVTSMKKEKREELKIDNKNELELYDQLVINEEKK
ncbi:MAG: HlyD family efflux transporter periplasmic adaptor subunit, partial [Clostridia bacterium]